MVIGTSFPLCRFWDLEKFRVFFEIFHVFCKPWILPTIRRLANTSPHLLVTLVSGGLSLYIYIYRLWNLGKIPSSGIYMEFGTLPLQGARGPRVIIYALGLEKIPSSSLYLSLYMKNFWPFSLYRSRDLEKFRAPPLQNSELCP